MGFLVYKITSPSNTSYIGFTGGSIEERMRRHVSDSRHLDTPLARAIKKYGKKNFRVIVLKTCDTEEEAKKKEMELIKKHNTYRKGYNASLGGDGCLGYKFTEEQKDKMRGQNNGMYGKGEDREGEKNPMYGKGYLISGKNHPMYGKKGKDHPSFGTTRTEEQKKRISEGVKVGMAQKKNEL